MDKELLENIKKQHVDNYRNAVLEIIKNNTRALVDDDIMSLIMTPPLDSMDFIKVKFLDFAKKNKIVLNTEELDKILNNYREDMKKCCEKIKKVRFDELSSMIKKVSFHDESETFILYKKDFIKVNKEIKRILKEQFLVSLEKNIVKQISNVYTEKVESTVQEKINQDMLKYLKGAYQRQLMENLDIKILVKDTTLMNGVNEQNERYLFTLANSRVLNDVE